VHYKGYDKDVARVTVAASYGTFALVQLLTLALFRRQQIDVPFADNAFYLVVGALVFVVTDEILYVRIEQERYRRIFAGFLAAAGSVLVLRALG